MYKVRIIVILLIMKLVRILEIFLRKMVVRYEEMERPNKSLKELEHKIY